ncbi:MAG: hypothetical protein ACRDQ5_24810, partial [Sciscionella sp.]
PGNKLYNTDGEHAYCAHPNTNIKNALDGPDEQEVAWHGFPISWRDVPTVVQREWIADGRLTKLRLRG